LNSLPLLESGSKIMTKGLKIPAASCRESSTVRNTVFF
jgi:hypothetical protein